MIIAATMYSSLAFCFVNMVVVTCVDPKPHVPYSGVVVGSNPTPTMTVTSATYDKPIIPLTIPHLQVPLPRKPQKIKISDFMHLISPSQIASFGNITQYSVLDLSNYVLKFDFENVTLQFKSSVGNFDSIEDLHELTVAVLGGPLEHFNSTVMQMRVTDYSTTQLIALIDILIKRSTSLYYDFIRYLIVDPSFHNYLYSTTDLSALLYRGLLQRAPHRFISDTVSVASPSVYLRHLVIDDAESFNAFVGSLSGAEFANVINSLIPKLVAKQFSMTLINNIAVLDLNDFHHLFINNYANFNALVTSDEFMRCFPWSEFTRAQVSKFISYAPPNILIYILKYIFRYDYDISARVAISTLSGAPAEYGQIEDSYGHADPDHSELGNVFVLHDKRRALNVGLHDPTNVSPWRMNSSFEMIPMHGE